MSIRRANPSTFYGKVLVGYQGWFTCPGDGEPVDPGHHGWLHWFNQPIPWEGGRPNTDLWPDIQEYSPSELFSAPGLKMQNGDPVYLFSSRHPKTVRRHFNWMAKTGVDGAMLQRFLGQCDVLDGGNQGIRRIRDEVGDLVRDAAEKEGRVFAIMYDVAGVSADRMLRIFQTDWPHLVRQREVLDSPNYLRHEGRPVLCLWGLGMAGNGHTPELVHNIVSFLRSNTPGGLYLIAGTPTHWRTFDRDAEPNPAFLDAWMNNFDCISPWTVGRFRSEEQCDNFYEYDVKQDVEFIQSANERSQNGKKMDYLPVILPGGSGCNLSEGRWEFNDCPRNGGRFLWRQLYNAYRFARGAQTPRVVHSVYGAMWDEYDEGTAYLPAVSKKRQLPVVEDPKNEGKWNFLSLDQEGYDLPSDWYMRVLGLFGEALRNERRIHETFPSKELQDYWSTRPPLEGPTEPCASGSSSSATPSSDPKKQYQEWVEQEKKNEANDAPPPAYTLVEDEPTQPSPSASGSAVSTPQNVSQTPSAPAMVPDPTPSMVSITESFSQASVSESSAPPLPPRSNISPGHTHQGMPQPDAVGIGGFAPPPVHPSTRPHRNQSYQGRLSASSPPTHLPLRPTGLAHSASLSSTSQPSQWPPQHWKNNDLPVVSGAGVHGVNISPVPSPTNPVHFPQANIPSFPSAQSSQNAYGPPTSPSFSASSGEHISPYGQTSSGHSPYNPPAPPAQPSYGYPEPAMQNFHPPGSHVRPPSVPVHSQPEIPRPGGPPFHPGRTSSPYGVAAPTPPISDHNIPDYIRRPNQGPYGTASSPTSAGYPSSGSTPSPYLPQHTPSPPMGSQFPMGPDNAADSLRPGSTPYGNDYHSPSSRPYPPAPSSSYNSSPQQPNPSGYPGYQPPVSQAYSPQYLPPGGPGIPSTDKPSGYPPPSGMSGTEKPYEYGPQGSGGPGVPATGYGSSPSVGSSSQYAGGPPYGGQNSYSSPQQPPYGSSTTSQYPHTSGASSSSAGGGMMGNAVGFAVSNAEKLVGKKYGGQLGSLASSGGKLFSKFGK